MSVFNVRQGDGPVILAYPHSGTLVPDEIAGRFNAQGRLLRDTDWHLPRLYDGLLDGATHVEATFHRYVIDANRDPSGASLYPGQNTTGLVPLTDFDDQPIWKPGAEPTDQDRAMRLERFHAPYHAALRAEIERVRRRHGVAILYDCHSIRSVIPFLFEGRLPDLNIGTDNGKTAAPSIQQAAAEVAAAAAPTFTHVVNGRFRGGWTTRHYGQPQTGVHAIQMELAQATHLAGESPPFAYDAARAAPLRDTLSALLNRIGALAAELKGDA